MTIKQYDTCLLYTSSRRQGSTVIRDDRDFAGLLVFVKPVGAVGPHVYKSILLQELSLIHIL